MTHPRGAEAAACGRQPQRGQRHGDRPGDSPDLLGQHRDLRYLLGEPGRHRHRRTGQHGAATVSTPDALTLDLENDRVIWTNVGAPITSHRISYAPLPLTAATPANSGNFNITGAGVNSSAAGTHRTAWQWIFRAILTGCTGRSATAVWRPIGSGTPICLRPSAPAAAPISLGRSSTSAPTLAADYGPRRSTRTQTGSTGRVAPTGSLTQTWTAPAAGLISRPGRRHSSTPLTACRSSRSPSRSALLRSPERRRPVRP